MGCCEEMMAEIVCAQTDPEIQRALVGFVAASTANRGGRRTSNILEATNREANRYQLPLSAMNTLAHMDGVTGRVYLRASVSSLADRRRTIWVKPQRVDKESGPRP
ncbi:hypothetical protein AK812_SmicGene41894 [Symbiodinium microadriaticum]|uniref:Uncharacterized protein n=1 Tax=Symbiodinium microadriaticum TaxID=2951 RepID=A0A1Q9C4Y3_SYMMI|nr:hypothetical protein AK812_SmicGene41894 [Symbiodinium microadriaticum]